MRGPHEALQAIENLLGRHSIDSEHLYHAIRGQVLILTTSVGEAEFGLSSRQGDVEQAPLFFEHVLAVGFEDAAVGELAIDQPNQEDGFPFEVFDQVDGRQGNLVAISDPSSVEEEEVGSPSVEDMSESWARNSRMPEKLPPYSESCSMSARRRSELPKKARR